ncbi:uncharacterized protein DC041_0008620 [Schistosoma bovis]|uniref:Uncharacterized protein n=1 Tax=Schistosoma bovis TaxID=6184 RepID=A0A430QKA3_SCHBO|nr:uncharacterized protein DC041_0008620 [Schistosoma bovis]
MGLADAIERLKNIVYSKSSKDRSEFGSNSRGFENYDPTRFYYMDCGDNGSYVDVECIATEEFIRVYGVDFDMQCSDFLVRLCSLCGLEAVDYTFLVPCEGLSGVSGIFWLSAPSRSRLGHWVNSDTTQTTLPSMVRLIAKCCFKKSAKLYQYPFLDTKFKYPITLLKTGREFLKELGHRITVHLPEDCTIVVRGHLDQPISKVLQKVSSERHVQLSNYYITDPQKGTILDPKDTFLNQNADQIELKERKVKSSKNSKSHKKSQNDDSLISNLEVEISTESKHKRRPAPSVPAKQQIIHRHLSPFADVPDKVQSSSCVTLPSKENDNKKLDDKRNSVVGSQANRDSISNCSQELRSKSFIVKDKSNSHKRKSSTMVNSNTKKTGYHPNSIDFVLSLIEFILNLCHPFLYHNSGVEPIKRLSSTISTNPKNNLQSPSVEMLTELTNAFKSLRKTNSIMDGENVDFSKKLPVNRGKLISDSGVEPIKRLSSTISTNPKNNLQSPSVEMLTELTNAFKSLRKTNSIMDGENVDFSKKLPVNRGKLISAIRQNPPDNSNNAHDKSNNVMPSVIESDDCCSVDISSMSFCKYHRHLPHHHLLHQPPSYLQRNFTMRANYSDPSLKDSGVKPVRRLSTSVSFDYKHNLKSPSIEMLTELTDAFKSLKKSTNIIDAKNVDFSKKLPVHRGRIKSAIRQNSSDNSNKAHDKSNNVMPSVIESDDCCSVDISS